MDAGFSLARTHYLKLVVLWLGFAAPMFIVCMAFQYWMGWSPIWSIMFFVWWWFKPLYELPLVMYLSKALFSEQISLMAAWKSALSHFWLLFKTYLTLARLSTARSLTYSVVFLELLPRKQRAARIQTLTMVPTRHYLLMLACFHIEYFLTYAIAIVSVALFASNLVDAGDWLEFFLASDTEAYGPWFMMVSAIALLVGGLVAPFYVTGGFLVYINRRMHLEAWDIEHRFRSILPRSSITLALVLVMVTNLGSIDNSFAEQRAQYLPTSEAADTALQQVLEHEDFGALVTRKIPKFKSQDKEDEDDENQFLKGLQDWLGSATGSLGNFIKLLLWIIAALFIVLLLHTLRSFRRPELKLKPLERGNKDEVGAMSHPLTQDLPTDIAGTARRLLEQGERRQALSVLFRGALKAVMDEYDMKINKGATESDCKSSISGVASEQQVDAFSKLLGVWQKEAYANQPQQEQLISSLIHDWTHAFSTKNGAGISAQKSAQQSTRPANRS